MCEQMHANGNCGHTITLTMTRFATDPATIAGFDDRHAFGFIRTIPA
jgi:hypothetical protein